MATEMRKVLVEYMRGRQGDFEAYFVETDPGSRGVSFAEYLAEFSRNTTFVNYMELIAFSRCFNIRLHVFRDFSDYLDPVGPTDPEEEPVDIDIGNIQDVHFVPITDLLE